MVIGTLTPELARSFEHLRQAVAEVSDSGIRDTITAVVDDLVINLENQMLLVFANCSVELAGRENLLVRKDVDKGLLDYYRESVALTNETNTHPLRYGELIPQVNLGKEQGHVNPNLAAEQQVFRSLAPDNEAAKTMAAYFYCLIESLAHNVQAEKATFYLAQKSSAQLRGIVTVPDSLLAQKGMLAISLHQGVVGNCFSTCMGIRIDEIDSEMRKIYFPNSPEISSVLVFPVLDHITNTPIGAIECLNKTHGLRWTESDECQMGQVAALLQYYVCHYGSMIDFHTVPVFNPVHIHMVQPYQPAFHNPELKGFPQAVGIRKRQLVARVAKGSKLPVTTKNAKGILYEVDSLGHVRELCDYLENMDCAYKSSVAELVSAKHRESDARDQIQKISIKLKVSEENVNHLHDQLTDAKRVILAQKISGADGTARYDGFGTYRSNNVTQRQSLTQRHLPKVKSSQPLSSASSAQGGETPGLPNNDSIRPTVLHDFMSNASKALRELQKKAMGKSDAAQRHKLFMTPQPRSSSPM